MQPFGREPVAVENRPARTTAVASLDFLDGFGEGQVLFRFVRHLPVLRHDAADGTGLRAGVGQTLGEETAGHGAVP